MNYFQKTESSYFNYLPIEIWENILKKLIHHPRSIVSASKVCRSWRHLVTTICKQFCLKNLCDFEIQELSDILVNPYLLENVFEEEENETRNWVKIFWYHHETLINTEVSTSEFQSPPFPTKATSLFSFDPYLVICSFDNMNCDETKLFFLNAEDVPFPHDLEHHDTFLLFLTSQIKPLTIVINGRPSQIGLLRLPTAFVVLFASANTDFQSFVLKRLNDANATRNPPEIMFTNPQLGRDWKISCDSEWLVTCDPKDNSEFLLYKAELPSSEKELHLQLMFKFKPIVTPYVFHIFKSMIYTVEPSGHARGYKIEISPAECDTIKNVSLHSQSDLKKDLRYPNPATFVRHFVLTSTVVSAQLLKYWHMDADRDFWIIGDLYDISKNEMLQKSDSSSNAFNIRLHKIYLGRETGFVVTAVHYQRGIWFLGTKEGHIIGCKLKTNGEERESSPANPDLIDLKPWMLLRYVSSQPIVQIRPLFTPLGAIVAVIDTYGMCFFVSFSSAVLS